MKTYELTPTSSRKSFYGKAVVIIEDDGSELLKSYETIIAKRDASGRLYRLWDGWSATTGNHLRSWAGIDKQQWDKMEVVNQ